MWLKWEEITAFRGENHWGKRPMESYGRDVRKQEEEATDKTRWNQ